MLIPLQCNYFLLFQLNRLFSYPAKEPGFYIFIQKVRLNGVRSSLTIVHIRKFYKLFQDSVGFRSFFRIVRRSIWSTFKTAFSRCRHMTPDSQALFAGRF